MKILTWNIQATKGCDDQFDISRIVRHIKSYGDLDVICLQEVSKNIADLNADDQPALITTQFPGYDMIWGPGFSAPALHGCRSEFGNLTLTRSGMLKNCRLHTLPAPPVEVLQMPRTMIEAIVHTGSRTIAIFNTHLAFHSESERVAQIDALTVLRDQITAKSELPELPGLTGPYIFSKACDSVILCGDLNIDSHSDVFVHQIIEKQWVDCWQIHARNNQLSDRAPTCGCYDDVQWPQGPHIRDYFLATANIAEHTISVQVDVETNASDHQPVFLEIAL